MAALPRPAQDALTTIRQKFAPDGQLDAVCIPRILLDLVEGDYEAAAILSKLVYWADKGANAEGWIYKTAQDWQADLRLTYRRLSRATKLLVAQGFMQVARRRIASGKAVMHYRPNLPALLHAIDVLCNAQSVQCAKRAMRIVSTPASNETSIAGVDETSIALHESTTFNTSEERDKSLSLDPTGSRGGVTQKPEKSEPSKSEKPAKTLTLVCGCGQTLDATREQAQAAGWKVPSGRAALPECPTCAAAPDPLFVAMRQYLGLKPDDKKSDAWVGMLANILVGYEKDKQGLAPKQPLERAKRAILAAQIPAFVSWYAKAANGANLPRSRESFQLWIGKWYAGQDTSTGGVVDTRPVSGAPLPDGYTSVASRPPQEPPQPDPAMIANPTPLARAMARLQAERESGAK